MSDPKVIEQALGILARARGYLKKKAPYIYPTLYGLIPQPVEGIGTMGVTPKMILYFDPAWIITEPAFKVLDDRNHDIGYQVVAGCLYHECCHVLRDFKRLTKLDNWGDANIAGDLPINDDLREAGWALPPWVEYPEKHNFPKGLTLEVYYRLLLKEKQEQEQKQSGSSGPPTKGSPTSGPPTAGNKPPEKPQKEHRVGGGCCGGIAGNKQHHTLEEKLDQDLGRDPIEVESIKRETLERIKEHQQREGCGSTPGFREQDLVFEKKQPKINWRREVQRIITMSSGDIIPGGDDYSMAHPSRQLLLFGIVLPGLIEEEVEFIFVRDTSASMGDEQVNDANNEIVGAFRKLGVEEAWLLDVDTHAYKPRRVRLRDIPKIPIQGRGGTNFCPAFEVAAKLRPKPDVLIYLTDGDGQAPATAPKGMTTIWCIVPTSHGRRPAAWGHLVVCSNDQKLRAPYGA